MYSKSLWRKLNQVRRLSDLIDQLPPQKEIHLVGGALRDLILGRESADFDFATPFDPTPLAQSFARRSAGHWFFLDEPRRQSRVVMGGGEGTTTFDFAPYRAADLEGDLRLRDFTANALALPLHREGDLFDPLGGLGDLSSRRLRACSPGVFEDDPLRVLKGVRHGICLGFDIEEETAALMRASAPRLETVAPERIRSELGAIFGAKPVAASLRLMASLGVTDALFSPLAEREFQSGKALAVRCEELMEMLEDEPSEALILSEETEANVSRAALLKLAAFGRGSSPDAMPAWAQSFKLSRRSGAIVRALAGLDPGMWTDLAAVPPGRPRALRIAALGRHPVEALIFLGALGDGEKSNASVVRSALRDFLQHSENGRVPDLLDGDEAGQILSLPPGPQLGRALAELRKEEIAGRVGTTEEAIRFLKAHAKKMV